MSLVNRNVIDAAELTADEVIETDFVVVGSGAGGGTAAKVLASSGHRVLIVEEGPYQKANDFALNESTAYKNLYQEHLSRSTADGTIALLQGRCVGGGTTVNWCTSFRLPDITLKFWQENYGITLTTENLRPWFEKVEEDFSIIESQTRNPNNQKIVDGCENLGWHWGKIARNVSGCENSGYCGFGCPNDAKQSTLVATIPDVLRAGGQLVFNGRADVLTHKGEEITGLLIRAKNSGTQQYTGVNILVKAKHYILSAGSIGSPGIMLRSKLSDPCNQIGKRTYLHPVCFSFAHYDEPINGDKGAPQTAYSDQFLWDANDPYGKYGFKIECAPVYPAFLSAIMGDYGIQHLNKMNDVSKAQLLIALNRDGFHPESRAGGEVTLNGDHPQLTYPIGQQLWKSFKRSMLAMGEMQLAAGARKVFPANIRLAQGFGSVEDLRRNLDAIDLQPYDTKLGSAHVMGGCAMGTGPEDSVVDQTGRSHIYGNLSVMDASVFPSSLGVNPQETIFALSAMMAASLVT